MTVTVPLSMGREWEGMGLAVHRSPIWIELKQEATPAQVRQYLMQQGYKKGITPHFRRRRDLSILIPC